MKQLEPLPHSSALIIARPGHELRIYGWLAQARPTVCVLTDGSGHTGKSRLPSTTGILADLHSKRGPIYGRLTDRQVYAAILAGDIDLFTGLADELTDWILRREIRCIVGDAAEGYNPAHDICRVIIDAAVAMARQSSTQSIANYDFAVVGRPDACLECSQDDGIQLKLDADTFNRKLEAARLYTEVSRDVNEALDIWGPDSFRLECIRPVQQRHQPELFQEPPFYESYGEKQVAAGYYESVVRYHQHFAPLAKAIISYAENRR